MALDERRPWDPDPPLASLNLDFDLTGPEEEGLSRAERRSLLEAACRRLCLTLAEIGLSTPAVEDVTISLRNER
jgi:hypothetical protein